MAKLKQGNSAEEKMKTYIFRIVLEEDRWPDEPRSTAIWRAHIPVLEAQGAGLFEVYRLLSVDCRLSKAGLFHGQ